MTIRAMDGTGRAKGVKIILDTDQIFPTDPGMGTPAMVYAGSYSATFWCALDTGEMMNSRGDTRDLTASEVAFLKSKEAEIDAWLDEHWEKAKAQLEQEGS